MKLNDAVARLNRAGDNNSRAWQKLREAVDELATRLAGVLPGGGEKTSLPGGYTFAHWPSKQYRLERRDSSVVLTKEAKDRRFLLEFCQDIHSGLLERIAGFLEDQSGFLESTTERLNQARTVK
mgnify:CR=1 FL=1